MVVPNGRSPFEADGNDQRDGHFGAVHLLRSEGGHCGQRMDGVVHPNRCAAGLFGQKTPGAGPNGQKAFGDGRMGDRHGAVHPGQSEGDHCGQRMDGVVHLNRCAAGLNDRNHDGEDRIEAVLNGQSPFEADGVGQMAGLRAEVHRDRSLGGQNEEPQTLVARFDVNPNQAGRIWVDLNGQNPDEEVPIWVGQNVQNPSGAGRNAEAQTLVARFDANPNWAGPSDQNHDEGVVDGQTDGLHEEARRVWSLVGPT